MEFPARIKKRFFVIGFLVLIYGFLNHGYTTPILMYHHIDERSQEWKLSVSPESFNAHMEFLKTHHYRVISLSDYAQRLKSRKRIPYKSVVITFDDGYENNFQNAYPVLRKFGFPATIFMQVDGLGRKEYMNREDLAILAENNIEIGSHTVSHPSLELTEIDKVRREVTESKKELEEVLGEPVKLFSYPGGGWNRDVREEVIKAGYLAAVATHDAARDHSDLFTLRRVRVTRSDDNLIVFWLKCSGFYPWIEDIRG